MIIGARALLVVLCLLAPCAALRSFAQTGRIADIKVTGSQKYAPADIIAASGLRVGDTAGREIIQAAADRLAQLGLFTDTRFEFSSIGQDINVRFQVQEAPTVPVSFDNFPWFTDAELSDALKQAVRLFDGTAPEQGTILDAMTEVLQKLLAARGVNAAVERTLMADPDGRMMQQFKVAGASLKISAVQFSDALASESPRVRERLSDIVGKRYSRFAVEMFLNEQVRPVYLQQGHLRVKFGKPVARFTGNPNQPLPDNVLVIASVERGPQYRWNGVSWQGNAAFGPKALEELIPLKPGDIADGTKILGAWERVEKEYGRVGYVEAKVSPEAVFDEAAAKVSYRVTLSEGQQYRMGELVITGLSLAAERKLLEAWRMPRGQVFDRAYFDEFLATGIKQAFADYVVHYQEVGHWLRTNPDRRTVDVLLDFK